MLTGTTARAAVACGHADGFLSELLDRPRGEKPFILFLIGYPAAGAQVPGPAPKPLEDVLIERL